MSSEAKQVKNYQKQKPKNSFYDLSQYPSNNRARCELVDGSLMTLARSSTKIYSKKHRRIMSGVEALTTHALPLTEQQARLCGSPRVRLGKYHDSLKAFSMAGNAMNVPVVGACLLAMVIGITDKDK